MNEKLKNNIYKITVILLLLCLKDSTYKDLYKNNNLVVKPDSISVLVNKQNRLSKFFIPENLELINTKYSYEGKMLTKTAKTSFEEMCKSALKNKLKIVGMSAYRSYEYQEKLYNDYVTENGKLYADISSARPGHSEHQTGLAIDVTRNNEDYHNFEATEEFIWMQNNAHKFGFILRYPKEKEDITGFKYEPWHYRYVGKEIAEYIHDNNITLEEYHNNLEKNINTQEK